MDVTHVTLDDNGSQQGKQVTEMSAMTALTPVGDDGTTRVRVTVPFDIRNSADLRQEFVAVLRAGSGPILVDISASTVIDQVGFATLLGAHARAARAGRRLRFTDADERTTRLLRRAGRTRLLHDAAVAPTHRSRRTPFAV